MDKLKLAFSIIAKTAKERRTTGEIPVFLGTRGMLALMYDRIAKFSRFEQDASEYVLDLAVMAVFAFANVLPEMEFDDGEESTVEGMGERESETDDSEGNGGESSIPSDNEEVSNNPRWSSIRPGDPLPRAEKLNPMEEEAAEDE